MTETPPDGPPPVNLARVLLVFTLLPLLLGLERWGYWSLRSFLGLYLRSDIGVPPSTIGTIFTVQAVIGIVCLIFGGAIAILTGPIIPLVGGMVISTAGALVLTLSNDLPGAWLAIGLLALGQGLAKPACFAAAASELGHPRAALCSAAFVLLYAVMNASALSSGLSAGFFGSSLGARAVFVTSTGAVGVAAVLAGVLGIAWLVTRSKALAPAPAGSPRIGRVLLGAVALIVLAVPYHALLSLTSLATTGSASTAWTYHVNPVLVLGTSVLVLPLLLVLHFRGTASPTLFVIAAGLVLAGLSASPQLVSASALAAAATGGILGIAEVLVGPFAMARVVGDVPGRFQALAMSAWLAASGTVSLLTSQLTSWLPNSASVFLAIFAVIVFGLGIAMAIAAKAASAWLYAPAEASQGGGDVGKD